MIHAVVIVKGCYQRRNHAMQGKGFAHTIVSLGIGSGDYLVLAQQLVCNLSRAANRERPLRGDRIAVVRHAVGISPSWRWQREPAG